jgi:hypothetical protein
MESQLARAAQQFIEQMPFAIAIFDGEMRYRAVSRRHLSDLAWLFSTEVSPPDKAIGRTFREVSPDMPRAGEMPMPACWRARNWVERKTSCRERTVAPYVYGGI